MWTLLQTRTEHFWSWYTEWQFGQLLFQMFSSIRIHTLTEAMISHYNLPSQPRQKHISQACNLFPAHLIQPIRCFHWRFSSSRMFSIKRHKFHLEICTSTKKKRLNGKTPRPFCLFSVITGMDFFSIFKNLSLAGSKNRKLNCSGLKKMSENPKRHTKDTKASYLISS